jgi:NAD(P)-dependent dehydrogenase (short-subunit alcohol dehydrogenase family)
MKLIESLFGLKNKTIIVDGGAGQIGFAMCKVLADAGTKVILADLDIEMAEDKIKEVE